MMPDDSLPDEQLISQPPLSNRFTKNTLSGCVGIACVFAMPALLFIPVDTWHLPPWVALAIPLVAFGAVALGALMLASVPATGTPTATGDPRHPLTATGRRPIIERPATIHNRMSAGVTTILVLLVTSGGVWTLLGLDRAPAGIVPGTITMEASGLVLVAWGSLISLRRAPVPALHWARVAIQERVAHQGTLLTVTGLVALASGLWIDMEAGLGWSIDAMVLLTVIGILALPIARRIPPRHVPHYHGNSQRHSHAGTDATAGESDSGGA